MVTKVEAVICSVWRRGERQEADRTLYFERDRCEGRVEIETLGLKGNMTFHTLPRADGMRDKSERAVLAQTTQTYAELRRQFPAACHTLGDGTTPSFGETFILDGLSCKDVCIGDVFKSSQSTLTLQVTSPRYGCMRVDKKHLVNSSLASGQMGTMRRFVNGTGRGGIFFRVLTPGEAGDNDRLQLVRRPHPKWSLGTISSKTFPLAAASCLKPTWNGTPEELEELCGLDELAFWEWKDVFRDLKSKGVAAVNVDAMSGNGSIQHVGVRLTGQIQCPDCRQKFDTERAKQLHWKFIHDPTRHQED